MVYTREVVATFARALLSCVIGLATACGARSALDDDAAAPTDASAPVDARSPFGEAGPGEDAGADADAGGPSCTTATATCDAGLAATCDGCAPPTVLATCQSLPGALAMDDASVVWINEGVVDMPHILKTPATYKDGAVMRCAASGCGNAPSPIAIGIHNLWTRSFAVVNGASYYLAQPPEDFELFVAPDDACTSTPPMVPGYGYAYAGDEASVYFTTYNQDRVYTCSGDCASATLLWAAPTQNDFTIGIAVDATDVYWTTSHDEVYRCAKAGCALSPTLLTQQGFGRDAIALDDANVYATDDSRLYACSKSGCASPTVLTTTHAPTTNLVTDGANLYWSMKTGQNAGGVFRCPVTGCAAPELIASVVQPGGIALDASRVYWSDAVSGTIASLPK